MANIVSFGAKDNSPWLGSQDPVPDSKMPPYDDLPERDLTDIADYLLSLP